MAAAVIARRTGFRAAWLTAIATAALLISRSGHAAPIDAAQPARFDPPETPLVLTRTFHRALPGGEQVVTRRSYELRFSPESGGYRIDGELIDAETDVPAPFEALAKIERNRPDIGMFPMKLDRRGRLLPKQADPAAPSARGAGRLALSQIPVSRLSAAEAGQARAFISRIMANPVHTAWPDDLFNPEPGKRTHTRTVQLADGKTGQVRVEIDARADSRTGLLSALTRRVTTVLDGSRRVTVETWKLTDGPTH